LINEVAILLVCDISAVAAVVVGRNPPGAETECIIPDLSLLPLLVAPSEAI
jgi:hypothetical protein